MIGKIVAFSADLCTVTVKKFHRLVDMHASFEARADVLYDRAGKLSSTMDEVVGCNCEDIIHVSQICDVAFILPCKVIDEGHLQISPKGMCRLLVQRIQVLEHEIDVCYKFQVCFPYFIFR